MPIKAPNAPKSDGPRTRAATMLSKKAAPLPTMVATPTRTKPFARALRESGLTRPTLSAQLHALNLRKRGQGCGEALVGDLFVGHGTV